jgi:hypothetical protein
MGGFGRRRHGIHGTLTMAIAFLHVINQFFMKAVRICWAGSVGILVKSMGLKWTRSPGALS